MVSPAKAVIRHGPVFMTVEAWRQGTPQADAAATSVANATWADDPAVEYCRTEELDPLSDLTGHTVVRKVDLLPEAAIHQALRVGSNRAGELLCSGMIKGAAIFVQGRYTCLPAGLELHPVVPAPADTGKTNANDPNLYAIER
jgi:hypothetical protein